MHPLVASVLSVAVVALSTATLAQPPAADQDHAAHHPAGASAPTPAPEAQTKLPPRVALSDTTMKSMHEMHAKMMAA